MGNSLFIVYFPCSNVNLFLDCETNDAGVLSHDTLSPSAVHSSDGDFHFLECLQSETGSEYKGDVSFTRSGVTCLRWDSVTGTSALDFPDWSITEVANKCRNPGNPRKASPWCYVNTTSGREAQSCFIPKCSKRTFCLVLIRTLSSFSQRTFHRNHFVLFWEIVLKYCIPFPFFFQIHFFTRNVKKKFNFFIIIIIIFI